MESDATTTATLTKAYKYKMEQRVKRSLLFDKTKTGWYRHPYWMAEIQNYQY